MWWGGGGPQVPNSTGSRGLNDQREDVHMVRPSPVEYKYLFMVPAFDSHVPKFLREKVKKVLPAMDAALEDPGHEFFD